MIQEEERFLKNSNIYASDIYSKIIRRYAQSYGITTSHAYHIIANSAMGKIVVANWKMNKGGKDGLKLFKDLLTCTPFTHTTVICPPYTLLREIHTLLTASSTPNVFLGAQNCSAFTDGAHTGDISAAMLAACGGQYVLCGHSERRSMHHETPKIIRQKIMRVQENNMEAILCIGENEKYPTKKETFIALEKDIKACLQDTKACYIAYEPVWSIGTGTTPSTKDIDSVHAFIKEKAYYYYNYIPHVIYGGSVTEENAHTILSLPHVDGILVGGASLEANTFLKIVR